MISEKNYLKDKVKVIDFSLCKIIGLGETIKDRFGTLHYIAPEVVKAISYGKESDVWSFGVMLFYMLSENLPFKSEHKCQMEVAKEIIKKELTFVGREWKTRSKECIDLVKRCLIKKACFYLEPFCFQNLNFFVSHP